MSQFFSVFWLYVDNHSTDFVEQNIFRIATSVEKIEKYLRAKILTFNFARVHNVIFSLLLSQNAVFSKCVDEIVSNSAYIN